MGKYSHIRHDFEATLRFLTQEEGGLSQPPLPGYRSGFKYLDYVDSTQWEIWPTVFSTEQGDCPDDTRVPHEVNARFAVLSPDLYEKVHRRRLAPGVRFQLMEGWHVIAEGIVTSINPRPSA